MGVVFTFICLCLSLMDFQHTILDIFFTLDRKSNLKDYIPFCQKYSHLLQSIQSELRSAKKAADLDTPCRHMILLFRLIAFTRDCQYGLGERDLSYLMIFLWYQYFPMPALQLLHTLPLSLDADEETLRQQAQLFATRYQNEGIGSSGKDSSFVCVPVDAVGWKMPLGSWKDMVGIAKIIRFFSRKGQYDPLLDYAISLMNHQLDVDTQAWSKAVSEYETARMQLVTPKPQDHISLVCKWIPRENSANHWLYLLCVIQWVRSVKPQYFKTTKNEAHFESAFRKAKREYRLAVSSLNKSWDVTEIKQCGRVWKTIDPKSVSSQTLHNQRRALLNIDSFGRTRKKSGQDEDRMACAQTFADYFGGSFCRDSSRDECRDGGRDSSRDGGQCDGSRSRRGKSFHNTDIGTFFRSVFHKSVNLSEQCYLQKSWEKLLSHLPANQHAFLPMLDLSLFENSGDRFQNAVGIVSFLSQVSSLGPRVLAFDETAEWVNLESCRNNVLEITEKFQELATQKHIGSNIVGSMSWVVQGLLQSHTDIDAISNMVLVLVGDYQVAGSVEDIHKKIVDVFQSQEIFAEKMPRIVYWNVGGENGSEDRGVCSMQVQRVCGGDGDGKNAFVFHGRSFATLRYLCQIVDFTHVSMWDFFQMMMSHPRYSILENFIYDFFEKTFGSGKPGVTG